MKKCNHKWEHKIKKGRCINEDCKLKHKWLIHKCKLCKEEAICGRIE